MNGTHLSTHPREAAALPSGFSSTAPSRRSRRGRSRSLVFQHFYGAIARELSYLRASVDEVAELLRSPLTEPTGSGGPTQDGKTTDPTRLPPCEASPHSDAPRSPSGSAPYSGDLDYDSEADYPLVRFTTLGSNAGALEPPDERRRS